MFKSALGAGASILALANLAMAADTMPAHPRFARGVGRHANTQNPPGIPTNWTFSWTHGTANYSAVFIGTNPANGAMTTTIPVEIIPVKMVVGATVENPSAGGAGSVVNRTIASPIFTSTTNYTQGGTNVGTTQYEDAFQRAALWGLGVSAQPNYHVLFGKPAVQHVLTVHGTSVATEFGVRVILLNINSFDLAIQSRLATLPMNSLPIFVTKNTFLTSGGCCIGGYHNYNGTQAYAMFTYITTAGVFSQDVSALSHEAGEWMDDPLINNSVACGIYEVGDPLEGGYAGHPYGTWVYGTYHLQDLVLPPYFFAPAATSVNGWSTFQGFTISPCANGG